jgi:oxygen-independent coproporphyrinogen-3 oxidase
MAEAPARGDPGVTGTQRTQFYRDLQTSSRELPFSPLMLKADASLHALPLEVLSEAGIQRKRDRYLLNISYPSMQAMHEVTAAQVTSSDKPATGKIVAAYIHVPFCTAECHYCPYYKVFGKSEEEVDQYLDGIDQELAGQERRFGRLEAASLYVGGGTPSFMSASQIDMFFTSIERHIEIPAGTEITFEMHPETVTDDRLAVLHEHGVNRINIGVESFNDVVLSGENRRHTAEEAVAAFERTRATGAAVNIDLIYGLRGETVHSWEQNLDRIAELRPDSTTMYYLRLKRGTPEHNLWKISPKTFPTDDELLLMHAMNFERMAEAGYAQNPTDWFIRDPRYFHVYQDHNWRRTDDVGLLGIGPSAYSYIDGWQSYNVNDIVRWQGSLERGVLPIWRGEHLTGDDPMRRTVMLGIKMGMNRPDFERTYGIDVVAAFPETWERLVNLGLTISPKNVDLTYAGKLFADEVGQQFYSDAMKARMAAIDPELVSTTWPQFNK